MTERWRKKLGDLDAQGPSDDVFERAKEGPMHAEEPLPRVKASTRILTAVAAFAVFALAISVFAIPALRMQGGSTAGGSSGSFPLWPSQDTDELRQLQGDADAGGAAWALDPHDVAIRFGQQVMGWSNAYASESIVQPCEVPLYPGSNPSLPTGTPSSGGFVACAWPGPASGTSLSLAPSTPSGSSGAYRSFSLFSCDPRQCGPDVPTEHLSIFQPLEQGEGQIWAVLSALSSRVQLSVVTGQNVRDGGSIHASFFGLSTPTLAYASCGAAGASSDVIVGYPHDLGPNETLTDAVGGIDLDVSLPASASCSGPTPGYVWAVQSGLSCAKPDGTPLVDPIKDAAVGELSALSAVPITALFPTEAETTAPTSPPSETTTAPGSITWSTYTDPYGWTIDVPDTWRTDVISVQGPGTQGARFIGDNLSIQVSTQTAESGSPPPGLTTPPQDDSHFPLSAADLLAPTEGGEGGRFIGDGLPFDVLVLSPSLPGPLPQADQDILERMISSISLQPWQEGDLRYDWAAIPTPTEDVSWMTVRGGLYMLFRVADGYKLYGAISCGGNDPSRASTRPDGYAVLECPDGSTWEMNAEGASGASGSGDAGKNDPPPQWPVITAFDGSLIAYVIPGEYPPGTGLSS